MMKKGYAGGGMMKKMMKAGGSVMKKMMAGGMAKKGYKSGGKLQMVEKDGKMVPFYAADGKGKMKEGGPVGDSLRRAKEAYYGKKGKPKPTGKPAKKKMMKAGGMAKKGYASGGMMKKGYASGGRVSARADGVARKGKTKGRMV
tara:strand:- start:164 stop:595 length:432 start_codon:yes stop_codon:yes gene_type:complete